MLCSSFIKKYNVNCSTSVFLNINRIMLHYCELMDYFLFSLELHLMVWKSEELLMLYLWFM